MLHKIIIFLIIPFIGFAQHDQKALDILRKVSATNESYSSLQIDFNYTLTNKSANVNDSRNGSLALMGDKFHLVLMGKDIFSDGKIIWDVMKEDQEVQIMSMNEFSENMDFNPTNIFRQYEKGYKSKYVGEKTVGGKTIVEIDLFPEIPGKKSYSRIRLAIDKKTSHIVSSSTFGKDGTDYQLEITKMVTNAALNSKLFVFNAATFENDGYDIEDFR
ncbi:outer membrane lipoprotein carrier protein LolA [Bacteroidota bacterium]